MKWMIASDIHGSAKWCERMLDAFAREEASRLLLLGDLLYHGPRNDLPEEYAPKRVIEMLNGVREKLLCVRGNCDTEVDQMVLRFPVMAEYCVLPLENRLIYATHGHVFTRDNPPPLMNGDVLLTGHTHLPAFENCGSFTYVNPGSVAIPKQNTPHSVLLLEGEELIWKDLESGTIFRGERLL